MPAAVGISLRRTATLKDARSALVAAAGANAGGVAAAAAARASRGPCMDGARGARGIWLFCEAFGCSHVYGLLSLGGLPRSRCSHVAAGPDV